MRLLVPGIVVFALLASPWQLVPESATSVSSNLPPAAQSMQRKLQHIESNGQAAPLDPTPTVLNEDEVNAYLNSRAVVLPKGVQRVRLEGLPGVVEGHARVDFDQLTEGKRSSNPLLLLFTGVHDVEIAGHARGDRGQASIHVDRVTLDGVEVPRSALEFFVERYLRPRYPQVGLDTRFQMPRRIDTAIVGEHKLTLVQK